MRIGLMHGSGGEGDIEAQVQRLVDEENDGFDYAWFGQVFDMDSLTLIALAGQKTSRINSAQRLSRHMAVIPSRWRSRR